MANRTTRSILAGAVEPARVSLSALYEGVQIPSSDADLTMSATVGADVPVYSEPASSGSLSHTLPRTKAVGAAETGVRVRISIPFPANDEEWVAVQVPEAAYGADSAKSTLAEPGIAYMSAMHAKDAKAPETGTTPVADFARVEPVEAQTSAAAPAATSSSTPSAVPVAASAAEPGTEPPAVAPDAETSSDSSKPFINALGQWPAALFAAMVMAATLYITKRRTV